MKKTLALIGMMSLILMLALLTGCGEQQPAQGTEPTSSVAADGSSVASATEPAPTSAEPEPVSRPTADGQAVQAYDLSFYVPSDLTPNEYNGMLGVYEFYTGEFVGSAPSGLDISLSVSDESNADGDLVAYAKKCSETRSKLTAEPESVTFNGGTWLRISGDGKADYYAIYNTGLYEIYTARGGDTQENYDAAVSMMEDTLFLAAEQQYD